MKYMLFIDLDGVLVDFENGVKDITGFLPTEQNKRSMWSQLAKTQNFYANLEWTRDGKKLWEYVKHHNPVILTGLPLGSWAKPQKLAWCRKNLGENIPVLTCFSKDKAKTAKQKTPQDHIPILIDDREELRESWEKEGGIFIHHKTAESSIQKLEKIVKLY
ncbi:hypothetical protein WKV44_07700 [Spirochaetia bacterium 38H-sp]|uniref:5' nucleotidase, deoxy (Pyrimidine), type C protein (NT5C) n=1 Tax=Rarispira pelagica TaxID=3141764 RepID=A0ABU9UCM7_9SPIR